MVLTERERWLLLVLTLILALGGGLGIALLRIAEVQHDQDRDMCDMLDALVPSGAPSPSPSSYGGQQRTAVQHYRERRC